MTDQLPLPGMGEMPTDVVKFLSESVHIDYLDLKAEFIKVPSQTSYWNAQFADAHKAYLVAKILDKQVFAALWSGGEGRVDDIKAEIENSMKMKTSRARLIEAEYERERLKGVCEAVRTKKEMLISLGAHVRAEMDNEPRIKEAHRETTAEDRDW